MKAFISILTGFCILVIASSCKINGSFQGLYGYQEKTMEEWPGFVERTDDPICSLAGPDSVVYAIDGVELQKCLSTINESLVYFWPPKCSSDACISPIVLQEKCREAGVELFIVAEYYDHERMNIYNVVERPIFGIDEDHYGTSLTSRYLEKFWRDATGSENGVDIAKFVLFREGRPVDSGMRVEEVMGEGGS